jgi:S1-C subfamily serine protease
MITVVEPGSPAAQAGLLTRDILVALDGKPTEGVDDLLRRLNAQSIGRTLSASVLRGGQRIDVKLTPSERSR